MAQKFRVVRDGAGWGLEDEAGILINQEPYPTRAAAVAEASDTTWADTQAYWSQSIFGE